MYKGMEVYCSQMHNYTKLHNNTVGPNSTEVCLDVKVHGTFTINTKFTEKVIFDETQQ